MAPGRIIKISLLLFLLSGMFTFAQQTKYELTKVEFHGNSAISTKELEKICLSKESPGWLSKFLNSFTALGSEAVYFDSTNVPLETGIIKSLYSSKGFFSARIQPSYNIDRTNSTAQLRFDIMENEQSYIRKFTITGLERLPVDIQNQLQDELIIDTNVVYSNQFIMDKRNYISSFLSNNGYMDVSNPDPVATVDTVKNRVEVVLNFNTGARFKVSGVSVEKEGSGKDLIDDGLVKYIFGIQPDTYFNQYENSKAQSRLWKTDLFESLEIDRGKTDQVSNLVELVVKGRITPMHELSPELIGNNEEDEINLGLALSFIKKNFFGDARKMTITASAATKNFTQVGYTDLRAAFDQPYLFGSQIRPRFETYFTNQLWKNKYDAVFYGAKLNLNFEEEMAPYTFLSSFSAYISWEYSKFNYQKDYLLGRLNAAGLNVADLNLENKTEDKITFSGDNEVIGLVFGYNKTNRNLFPTNGLIASLVLEDGNSFLYLFKKLFNSSYNRPLYIKTILNIADFSPLWDPDNLTIGVKFKAGSILTYRGDKINIPVNQRFYGGGSNSIRGWKNRDLVPISSLKAIGTEISNEDLETLLKKASPGGFLILETSLELRARLDDTFCSAIFIDCGNTWNELREISIKNVAVAAGTGIRIYTPFLPPIRIDFGFKIYDPIKQKMDLNKSIGNILSENLEIQFGFGEAF